MMEAGQSQEPTLFRKEDTEDWHLAQKLEDRLERARAKQHLRDLELKK